MARQINILFAHSGIVIHGEKVGREVGFPTANLDRLPTIPQLKKGVYAGVCELNRRRYNCLAYFGPRLIFSETKDCFEIYLYDFDQEIYGQELSCQLHTYLRPPMPFKSLIELQIQLEKDKENGQYVSNH